ncbi:hypothetical protein RHGRI_018391 [Rhododendron griersonianum]|uniref:Yippee domain-containing protein n=1 Tax=Rhododendron griersonianum TaxID=479676 RepID=A0AAV6K1G9_9ERIC|nr:hypothetical protein RHGRI_018391 [Rhododendron griersonianum]
MGRLFVVELEGRAYRCKFCKTHLALADDLVSRLWYMACNVGQTHSSSINTQSDAQLSASVPLCSVLSKVSMMFLLHEIGVSSGNNDVFITWKDSSSIMPMVNITYGPHEERMMLSGMHTVVDIFCCCCGQIVGWKYESAQEKSQKYKEGKFVLERGRILDGVDSEFYIDTRPSLSDAEDP